MSSNFQRSDLHRNCCPSSPAAGGHASPYTAEFYQSHQEAARRSANVIVPLISELVKPKTVIDIGCGTGVWLSVFRERGIEVQGVDGDHVDRERLEIPSENFTAHDLKQPLRVDTPFDLVVSLEVAEHLPAGCAGTFVESLVSLGPVILFSAAIPGQQGTHHVNEQWPAYWAHLFAQHDYIAVDCLRRKIWQDDEVQWWYAENILIFVAGARLNDYSALRIETESGPATPASLIHPKLYESWLWKARLLQARAELAEALPTESVLLLADDGLLGEDIAPSRKVIPMVERDGEYSGPPTDDDEALREFERQLHGGANFMVFAWPAFWWLDYYTEFRKHLRSRFQCVLENDRLVVFDLRG